MGGAAESPILVRGAFFGGTKRNRNNVLQGRDLMRPCRSLEMRDVVRRKRVLRTIAPIIVFGCMLCANHVKYRHWNERTQTPGRVPVSGRENAPNFTLPKPTGEMLALTAFRGRPVVVEFWATWCGSCRTQLVALSALDPGLRAKIGLVAINVEEESKIVRSFLDRHAIPAEVLLDSGGLVAAEYRVDVLPTTVFVGGDGRVLLRHVGRIQDWNDFVIDGLRRSSGEAEP